jgi:hypothetical protein
MAVSSEQFMELMSAQMKMNSEILNEIKELKRGAKEDEGREEPPGLEAKKKKEVTDSFDKSIDMKNVKVNNFNGATESYEDWAFAFKRTIRIKNKKAYHMIIKIEEMNDIMVDEEDIDPDNDFPGIEERSAELYDVLCQHLTGEPMTILRSVKDMHGFAAWQRLHRKYNPRTMARGLRMLTEVIQPPRAKNLSDIEGNIIKWEEKAKGLASQFKEELSNGMKLAIFTSMLPDEMQDFVYTHADQKTQYEDLREKVRAMASNKVAKLGSTPMDVDQVEEEETWHEDWEEIDAVSGQAQCYNCSQWGHFARECPKGKGKGKGKSAPHGGGKGAKGGKGGGPQYGKGGKGGGKNGKAFSGQCYNCNQWGHIAANCLRAAAAPVQSVEVPTEDVEVGGCWEIAAVDVNNKVTFPPLTRNPVKTKNRFLALDVEAEDDHGAPTLHHQCVPVPGQPRKAGAGEKKKKVTFHHQCVPIPGQPWGAGAGEKKTFKTMNVDICPVEAKVAKPLACSMQFHVADVTKPLAAAAKVVEKGNRIVLDAGGSYIEHAASGERMQLYVKKGVYVFDVTYEDGEQGTITLDSGAGVNVWPKNLKPNIKTEPKKQGLNMFAANGTPIEHVGTKTVRFKGIAAPFPRQSP